MSITIHGPWGMLVLGMVLGFTLLFATLLVVAEWNDVVWRFNSSYIPGTPWKFVMSMSAPWAWPTMWLLLRLRLYMRHQKPVSAAKVRHDKEKLA